MTEEIESAPRRDDRTRELALERERPPRDAKVGTVQLPATGRSPMFRSDGRGAERSK
jgi:hypothetical protein